MKKRVLPFHYNIGKLHEKVFLSDFTELQSKVKKISDKNKRLEAYLNTFVLYSYNILLDLQ